ncbi:MAG TPA: 16S rRNA (guanine(527)-N(7))-methyltransferase RsmG [Pyrinomonadaceae bacterium]|nr:16S rRNA (guanine(527)-N(7))-methyltransferase RsmG [Pyrinomonadaceae bacterium]
MAADKSRETEFITTLESDAADYGVELSAHDRERLAAYYTLLESWNPRLHLVAPCSPQELARRHILESLLLVRHLTNDARVADIGSGAGLPIIPCLIVRSDIKATLIESSKKKAVFLREALNHTQTNQSATVIGERFEEVSSLEVDFITCRALDRLISQLPTLIEWAPQGSTLLLFAGSELRTHIERLNLRYSSLPIPFSKSRLILKVHN